MNYNSRHNPQDIFSEHLAFAKKFAEPLSSAVSLHTNERNPNRRLRIGYCSPDFRRHAVAYFIEPVLAAHNGEHFEIFCYSLVRIQDEVTKRIQGQTDQWRSMAGMSDEDAAELIRKEGIDILVDLAGHTAGNRILLFARKPAPVQVSWIGYFATTGLSTMDYKIVDGYTDPTGKTEQFYTEKLIRMPESFLCYLPDRESPEVRPLPALSAGHVTFGSFNNFAKVTPEVFTLWARVLQELPGSRLILKGSSFSDETTRQYARNMFQERGISAERITLQSWDPSPKHFASYHQVDIGLDTFPFNGATTTCEAMWMGVPVITLEGTAYHSRAGVSLLSNVGLPELIATTEDEYTGIAVHLASDIEKLDLLRKGLRDRMSHSPLTDAERFTANLELCYRKMWEDWCTNMHISAAH
jgi:predicted O-linked N-acetylglucosamine transferase (SPINDLY family)